MVRINDLPIDVAGVFEAARKCLLWGINYQAGDVVNTSNLSPETIQKLARTRFIRQSSKPRLPELPKPHVRQGPDPTADIYQLTVKQLRSRCEKLKLNTRGNKTRLRARLQEALG